MGHTKLSGNGEAHDAPTMSTERSRVKKHMMRLTPRTWTYERGVDLVAIQQMLGHWHVGTTMRYVTPSATFIEDAYRRAVSGTLAGLEGDGDAD